MRWIKWKKDKTIFKDKSVAIFGGGDSALDWAIELSNTSKVSGSKWSACVWDMYI